MTPQAKRMRPWVKDLLVFVGLVLLNFFLICMGSVLGFIFDFDRGNRPGVSDLWLWVFATPPMIARMCGREDWVPWLVRLNPLVYGATWWLMWKMFWLMRPKPPAVP